MTPMSPARRLLCSVVALTLSGVLFRGQVGAALITRGDDAMRSGDHIAAIRFYDRAHWLDPRSGIASDRLAFYLAIHHRLDDARRAVEIATATLRSAPGATDLYADRGLAELVLHRWKSAEADFARAGRLGHDARYDHFAARMALRVGDRDAARTLERHALADDPAFAPARALVRTLE